MVHPEKRLGGGSNVGYKKKTLELRNDFYTINQIFVVSHLKYLTMKFTSLGITKMWYFSTSLKFKKIFSNFSINTNKLFEWFRYNEETQHNQSLKNVF